MSTAAVGNKKTDERADAFDVGPIDYRTTVPRAADQSRTGKNAQMRRERVVPATDKICDGSSRQAVRLGAHETLKNFKSRWLAQGGERG
jgi:hypothetical protein